MPVEILELIVRANVQESPADTSSSSANTGNENDNFQKQVLIEECVEQVLEILKHRNER